MSVNVNEYNYLAVADAAALDDDLAGTNGFRV